MTAHNGRSTAMLQFKLDDDVDRANRLFIRLRKDESGATLIEYSLLIGLISAAVIGLLLSVSGWVETQWSALNSTLT